MAKKRKNPKKSFKKAIPYLIMLAPAVTVVFLFNYLPIYGVLIAFQDFMPGDSILSKYTIWVGTENFRRFFTDVQFWPLMKNTFLLCIYGFIIGFPLPILVALALNTMKSRRGAKWLQTIFTAPHFISLVVMVGMLQFFFGRYTEQKNLILGNKNNRPDAIYHAGMSAGEIIKYAQRNVLLPISDYLEYMPNFSKILSDRPDIYSQLINVQDGKIYSLPRIEEMGLLQNPNLLFLNKNWAAAAIDAGAVNGVTKDQLTDGITFTSAQMESFLKYFKENDMNGNGKNNDERPLSFVYNNWQGNQCDLYGMFGLNDNLEHRVIIDGKVTYTVQDDRFKTATNFIANWVKNGYIDKVSFEQSQDNFLANGKGLETYGAFYWWESATVVEKPENYIVCAPLVGPDGSQTVCVSNNPEVGTGEVIIFSECKNPEVLLAYFDRFYDPYVSAQVNYGPIGIVYEEATDANGKLVQKPVPEGMTTDELRLQNAPFGICYLSDYALTE